MLPECAKWGALPQAVVSSSPKEASRQRPLASVVRQGTQARGMVPPWLTLQLPALFVNRTDSQALLLIPWGHRYSLGTAN